MWVCDNFFHFSLCLLIVFFPQSLSSLSLSLSHSFRKILPFNQNFLCKNCNFLPYRLHYSKFLTATSNLKIIFSLSFVYHHLFTIKISNLTTTFLWLQFSITINIFLLRWVFRVCVCLLCFWMWTLSNRPFIAFAFVDNSFTLP